MPEAQELVLFTQKAALIMALIFLYYFTFTGAKTKPENTA